MAHDTIPEATEARLREARAQVEHALNGSAEDHERLAQVLARLRTEAHWLHTLHHPETNTEAQDNE